MTSIGFFPGRAGNTDCVHRLTANTDSAVLNSNPQKTPALTESKPMEVSWENRLLSIILTSAANLKTSFPVPCTVTEMLVLLSAFTPFNTACSSLLQFV